MKFTKYTHACVRLDDGGRTLVIDPGAFSELDEALDGADAVLITHEHVDHLDLNRVLSAAEQNPHLRVWAPQSLADSFAPLQERFAVAAVGENFEAAGFAVQTFGGQHAVIHSSIPVISNVGYLIDDHLYHPGDSFAVPTVPVQTLLVPIHAPWSKVSEVIDFVIAVRAPQAFQVHDGLLNELGLGVVEGHVTRIGAEHGSSYRHLAPRETLTL
ncbi:beta-lactamase family protein [Jatrophihabitans sp. GAS493]|uniref:MBL fold metallo-hydrolase n=1 Tax=Jatrophihabitans sp. GAS493 TaxID=1907575 RepID=UPI000BB7487D|nr:MBL fold metallo-hydrolase [Jatrophihabitans sp. GAS493]SOD70410.1 beta-lactamase family protein [Jatrophihabitans sp. GAS493]